jgi:Zn-dependent protease with chaperone function
VILLMSLVAVAAIGSALVSPLSRWAQSSMTPSAAVILTTAASLAAAFGLGISLSALAVASLAGWGPIAREGHVSASVLHSLIVVPLWLGVGAAVVVAGFLARATLRASVVTVGLCRSARLCHDLPGDDSVVFTDDADIVTIAGWRGRILVGRSLFDRLEPAEQGVVLAHERSHLRRRHHLYVQAADLAAAANPLLAGVPDTVRLGIERWADEDAASAATVADRDLAARALARVALLRQRLHAAVGTPAVAAAPIGALAVAALQVSTRVRALLGPPPRFRISHTVLITAVAAMALAAGLFGLAHVNDLIELAQFHPQH